MDTISEKITNMFNFLIFDIKHLWVEKLESYIYETKHDWNRRLENERMKMKALALE